MIPFRFHPEVEDEFADSVSFYESRVVGLGGAFALEVERTVTAICEHPDSGSPLGPRTRRALVHRFPHSVIYAKRGDHTLILAIAHHHRRPGYWRSRAPPR